eukprot:Gb_02104 [translate_table: standard]
MTKISFCYKFHKFKKTFYNESYPNLESIVNATLESFLEEDITQAAGLLILHFHDCFVQGCDASILLDGTTNDPSEQEAAPNLTLRAQTFKIINTIKAAVEAVCSGVVSCADILTLATRDSIKKAGGPKYVVPLGRRDILNFANSSVTEQNRPPPTSNVTRMMSIFGAKGFKMTDLVALSSLWHSIGISHCASFTNRLYPTLDPTFAKQVLLTSDEALNLNSTTQHIAKSFSQNQNLFFHSSILGMLKMSQLGVLTGSEGEIRKNCSISNSHSDHYSIYLIVDRDEESSILCDDSSPPPHCHQCELGWNGGGSSSDFNAAVAYLDRGCGIPRSRYLNLNRGVRTSIEEPYLQRLWDPSIETSRHPYRTPQSGRHTPGGYNFARCLDRGVPSPPRIHVRVVVVAHPTSILSRLHLRLVHPCSNSNTSSSNIHRLVHPKSKRRDRVAWCWCIWSPHRFIALESKISVQSIILVTARFYAFFLFYLHSILQTINLSDDRI